MHYTLVPMGSSPSGALEAQSGAGGGMGSSRGSGRLYVNHRCPARYSLPHELGAPSSTFSTRPCSPS